MAIPIVSTFTALGHMAYALKRAHAFADATLSPDVTAAVAGLGVSNADIGGPLAARLDGLQGGVSSQLGSSLKTAAQQYLLRVVNTDVPLGDRTSVSLALAELIRQMIVQSYRVSACTVTAMAAPATGNVGNGAVVLTTKRGDGRQIDTIFAEVGVLTCTGDAQAGSVTAGNEPFQYRGDQAPADVMRWDWPGASGAQSGANVVDAAATSPNLLTNSDFEDFATANTPDSWTVAVGTPGTDVFSESSVVYAGAKALKFLGVGSTRPTLRQTLTTLKPNRVYTVNLWAKAGGTLTSTSSLKVRLVDGSNTVINDDAGNPNGLTQTLVGLTTTYTAYSGVLITPKVLPAVIKLQVEASNGADLITGEAVYIDQLSLAEPGTLYQGGPGLSIFAGSVPFMTNDTFDVTTTNNHNGQTYGATWQRVFHRWFGTPQLGLLLPTAGTTLLNDSLIA